MKEIKTRFLEDVKGHVMEVVQDDGVHRHLKFSNNGSSCYHFNIVTWNGYLNISGDMHCYTFSRLSDMFNFFRNPDEPREDLYINPQYWEEKICHPKPETSEFSERRLKEYLQREHDDHVEFGGEPCWSEIKEEILNDVDGECRTYDRLQEFDHKGLTFHDSWEWNLKEHTHHFIWCLCAISWAISEYDEFKKIEASK